MSQQAHEKQLHMLWPERLLHSPPPVVVPAGYALRTLRDEDKPGHLRVMAEAGFDQWNEQALEQWLFRVLPDGFFVVVHRASGQVVATAMATHNPSELHPYGGELGWVAASPQHAGRGLGMTVCAAVTARYLQAGYRRIYLKTDDFRLPAIKTYLKLGYVPFLYAEDMASRWREVCAKLSWPFTPDEWPRP